MDKPHKLRREAADSIKPLPQRQRQQARKRWLTENRARIDAYNEQTEKYGIFSDGLRAFSYWAGSK
jgi:post-segregation antitoxin (ccd killing protein)